MSAGARRDARRLRPAWRAPGGRGGADRQRDRVQPGSLRAIRPGLYGPENGRRALNLSTKLDLPAAAPTIAGARQEEIGGASPERVLGPWLLAAAVFLLAIDLLVSLWLRGLLRPALGRRRCRRTPAAARAAGPRGRTESRAGNASCLRANRRRPARRRLAQWPDRPFRYVNHRTAAELAEPAAVIPGQDDLSFYPLIYWPISADASPPSGAAIAALNDYMAHGGIILIDTQNGGSGRISPPRPTRSCGSSGRTSRCRRSRR